ncbi:hypothetical protein [Streptococcus himalayensis]|uniref:Uncharacterized protein n=1 Tax=Streptococcus himalayensis TaxID=1888195 RepID=A0A917A374_9STRE|nr:hypothetical protein [Streptococcus himalayensis]GGE24541.1 hypothetical protein GCM10011510_02060 [Streptococcus himalayensis]
MLNLKNAAVMELTAEELMEVEGGYQPIPNPYGGGGPSIMGYGVSGPVPNYYSSMYNGLGWWGNIPSSYYKKP